MNQHKTCAVRRWCAQISQVPLKSAQCGCLTVLRQIKQTAVPLIASIEASEHIPRPTACKRLSRNVRSNEP